MRHDATRKGANSDRRELGHRLFRLAIVFVVVCLAGIVFWSGRSGRPSFEATALAVLATFPLMLLAVLLVGWRLAVLAGNDVKIRDGVAVNAIAQLVVLLVPSRISELAKPVGLNLICNFPFSRGFAALVIERLLDAAFLAGLALAAVAVLTGSYRESMQSSGLVFAAVATIGLFCVGIVLVRPALFTSFASRLPTRWAQNQAEHVIKAITSLANPRATMLALGLSGASWLVAYLIFFVFFTVLGIGELSPRQILVVFVASTLGLIVSVAPGGLGTFEGATALSLAAFGFPMDTAIAMALLLRLCLVIPVVSAASWFLVLGDLSLWRILARVRNWKGQDEQSG